MKINEAVLFERFVEIDKRFFTDFDNKVIVYENPSNKRDVIVHTIVDGKHEFIRKKGNTTQTIAKANHGSKQLNDIRERLISEGYQFNKTINWGVILGGFGIGSAISQVLSLFRRNSSPMPSFKSGPEDNTTFGLSAQDMGDVYSTIDTKGVPLMFFDDLARESVNRFGMLDLNTLESKIDAFLERQANFDPDRTITGWEILMRSLELW